MVRSSLLRSLNSSHHHFILNPSFLFSLFFLLFVLLSSLSSLSKRDRKTEADRNCVWGRASRVFTSHARIQQADGDGKRIVAGPRKISCCKQSNPPSMRSISGGLSILNSGRTEEGAGWQQVPAQREGALRLATVKAAARGRGAPKFKSPEVLPNFPCQQKL